MELVHSIEKMAESWFKQAPHLPKGGRDWLASNVWWLVIIGVVVSAWGLLLLLPILFGVSLLSSSIGMMSGVGSYVGLFMVSAWVSFAFGVLTLIVEAMAIKPLQDKKKKGWDLMFLAVLLSAVSSVVSIVLTANPMGIIGAVIGLLIGGYFLFEIRDHFVAGAKAKK
jgi:hypothetical protein